MDDRQRNYKFNPKNGGVVKIQEEMRKNIQSKRRQDRYNLSGDNRINFDEWDSVCFSLENQVLIIHSTDEIVFNVKSHPYLDEHSTYLEGYIQNASLKLKDCIKSAIDLLQQQRAIYNHIHYRFATFSLTADKLPILKPVSAKNDEHVETDMDTSEVTVSASITSDENGIGNIADLFITQGTVECAWKIWLKLLRKVELSESDLSLFRLLIEFIAFISSLRPSFFNLLPLEESLGVILQTIELPLSRDLNHITDLLFFLYNIFEAKYLPPNTHSFILSWLIPAIKDNFHYFASTLSDTHSTTESTIKFFMGVSVIVKFAFEHIKTTEPEQKFIIYQDFKPLLIDSVKVMVNEYPFISSNLSSTLADCSDFYIDILTQESVYYYIIKTMKDSNLVKNSSRMAINLATKLETNEFENFLIKSGFFFNFAESLKFGRCHVNRASSIILEIMFRRLPLSFIAVNFIESGLFNQMCEHFFWGSAQDRSNFLRITPAILSCEQSSRYIEKLLASEVLTAFFSDLHMAPDDQIFNAICCVYKLLEWSRNAGKMEIFKLRLEQAGVLNVLWHADITSRANPELNDKRINILKILHSEFAS